jgi:putative hydrolase of the HAD superfamily
MKKIKLITFDLDDTFWDIGPVIINAELSTRKWLEKKVGAVEWGDMESFLALRKDLAEKDESFYWDLGKLRREIFRVKLAPITSNEKELNSLVDESFKYFLDKRHEIIFYDGVINALKDLSTRYQLGVLTNGNADINRLNIGEYFKFSVSSVDVKSNKPDRGHFQKALDLSGFSADEVIHIGDHQINDVVGALNLGMKAIWFNKNGATWEQESPQPKEISDWNNYKLIEEIA